MRYLSLIIFAITILPYYVHSFCVYNQHTDGTSFLVKEVEGFGRTINKAFKQDRMPAGEKQCCNYNNKDCVIGANPNAIIRFYVHRFGSDGKSVDNFDITCPGGGSLFLGGTAGNPTIAARWADGANFPFTKSNSDVKRVWAANLNETRTVNDQEQVSKIGVSQNKTEASP